MTALQPSSSPQLEADRFCERVVATGSSAGGLHALSMVLSALPASFPAAIVVVQHVDPTRPSLLVPLLSRQTKLTVRVAGAGVRLQIGTVYIAPPDHHLMVRPNGRMTLTRGAKVQYVRPAADVLLASVAASCGARAAAVILSGTGHDGADGCRQIKQHGGYVILQDEASSEFPGMPNAARDTGVADLVLPLADIGPALITWANGK